MDALPEFIRGSRRGLHQPEPALSYCADPLAAPGDFRMTGRSLDLDARSIRSAGWWRISLGIPLRLPCSRTDT